MKSCKDITRVCSDELERPLSLGERASLRMHLLMCSGCANYRRQLRVLSQAMHAYAQGEAPRSDNPPGEGGAAP